ncbi:MAG: DHH family phosphoesterase [Candidatus Euphemobacter frigidus]|nr:DHH family phosphoesterase [Candidatus Euphemobacter frigidus]MDP8274989.1 DHH family phosphoesterase [Candidatus Euphemobacter frigidus]
MKQADHQHKGKFLSEIVAIVSRYGRFSIFSHEEPDGDAIGSQIAMTAALLELGKEVISLRVDPFTPALEFLNRDEIVRKYDPLRDNEIILNSQVTIILDCCDYFRLGDLSEIVERSPSFKINIDHHSDNAFFGDLNYVRFEAGGAAELVFEVIRALGIEVTGIIAEAIYVGMSTDTVGFRYIDPDGNILGVISELIKGGIDVEYLQEKIYCNQPDSYLEDLTALLKTVNYESDNALAWFTMYKSDYLSFYQRELASEVLKQLLNIKRIRAAVMLHEEKAGIEVWLRSKKDINVCRAAERIGGGGHHTASGALIRGKSLEEGIKETLSSVRKEMEFGE